MFCSGCLNTEAKLRTLDENLTRNIREFLGLKDYDLCFYKYMCWKCYGALMKSIKFKEQCLEARNMVLSMVNITRESLNTLHMSNFNPNLTRSKVVLIDREPALETNEDSFFPIIQEIKTEIPDEGTFIDLNETSCDLKINFTEVNVISNEHVKNCKDFTEDDEIAQETIFMADKEIKQEIVVKEECSDASQEESVDIAAVESGIPSDDETPLKKILEKQDRINLEMIDTGAPAIKRISNEIWHKAKRIKLNTSSTNAVLKKLPKNNCKTSEVSFSKNLSSDTRVDITKSNQSIKSVANWYEVNKISPEVNILLEDKVQGIGLIVQDHNSKVCYNNAENETFNLCFPKSVDVVAPSTSLDKSHEGNKTKNCNIKESENELTSHTYQNKCAIGSILNMHIHTQSEEKPYVCDLCDYRCSRKGELNMHIKYRHTKEKNFSCHMCQYKCVTKRDLNIHLRRHTGEKPYTCDLCDNRFSQQNQLKRHTMYKHTKEKNFSCHMCQYKCVIKEDLNRHIRKHTEEKPYVCDLCDYKFSDKRNLRSHIKCKHTKEKNFSCHVCQYKCFTKSNLNVHLRKHTGEKPYKCDLCDNTFAQHSQLRRHIMYKHTKEKNFSCHMCQYKCVIKDDLNRHLRKHTEEKPYVCNLCDYKFSDRGNLRSHIKFKHTKEKNFSCHICQYKCVTNSNLTVHLRKHTGEKPYACDFCDNTFSQQDQLRRHIMHIHTKEKNFSCHMCQYKCVTKGELKVHLRKHTGEKPYKCENCDYKCAQLSHLKSHLISRHTKNKTG